jgi:hypothetical protein
MAAYYNGFIGASLHANYNDKSEAYLPDCYNGY